MGCGRRWYGPVFGVELGERGERSDDEASGRTAVTLSHRATLLGCHNPCVSFASYNPQPHRGEARRP
jgi:hypothetical protein